MFFEYCAKTISDPEEFTLRPAGIREGIIGKDDAEAAEGQRHRGRVLEKTHTLRVEGGKMRHLIRWSVFVCYRLTK